MKVSIVIPVYNAERYLDECVQSALDQTHPDTEIIAVDDGSTDTSPEILAGYGDKIRILSKPNGGTASALNAGIARMSGRWFKWLSADDLLKPQAAEVLAAASLRCENPLHIAYGGVDVIDGAASRIGEWVEGDYNGLTCFERNVRLLDAFYGSAAAAIIPATVFARAGTFDESIGFNEDYEFWLRCCLLHGATLHGIRDTVAAWRRHGGQLTESRQADMRPKNEAIRRAVLGRLPGGERARYERALRAYRARRRAGDRRRRVALRRLHILMRQSARHAPNKESCTRREGYRRARRALPCHKPFRRPGRDANPCRPAVSAGAWRLSLRTPCPVPRYPAPLCPEPEREHCGQAGAVTMDAPREGAAAGDASAESRLARHGPRILRHLFGEAASPPPASESTCPPRLFEIVRNAMLDTAGSGRQDFPAAAPSLDEVAIDPDFRQLAESLPAAMEKAGGGLCAGFSAAELRAEITERIIGDVRNAVLGGALEGMRRNLLGGDRREQEICLAAIGELAAEHLAIGLAAAASGGAPASGADSADRRPLAGGEASELVRAALLYAEQAAPLVAKIARAIDDAVAGYARTLGVAERGDPTIAAVSAVARAVAGARTLGVLRDPLPPCGPRRRGQGGGQVAECICREIARHLAGPCAKIDGQEARGERGAWAG